MKAYVDKDEWYPVFVIEPLESTPRTWCDAVEVPDELVAEYKAVVDAFDNVQRKLKEYER